MAAIVNLFLTFLAVAAGIAAADSDLLQDFCVADLTSAIKLNGYPCKDATKVSASDFHYNGLVNCGSTNTTMGSVVTAANVEKIPGVNTLGISMSRIDFAPGALNPPHTHPRATEMIFVLEGDEIEAGFITTTNKVVSKGLKKGDVFVFPKGLIHYQKNKGKAPASVLSAFNSQFPGTQSLGPALFGAEVPVDVVSKAFQIGPNQVKKIKSGFKPPKK